MLCLVLLPSVFNPQCRLRSTQVVIHIGGAFTGEDRLQDLPSQIFRMVMNYLRCRRSFLMLPRCEPL